MSEKLAEAAGLGTTHRGWLGFVENENTHFLKVLLCDC